MTQKAILCSELVEQITAIRFLPPNFLSVTTYHTIVGLVIFTNAVRTDNYWRREITVMDCLRRYSWVLIPLWLQFCIFTICLPQNKHIFERTQSRCRQQMMTDQEIDTFSRDLFFCYIIPISTWLIGVLVYPTKLGLAGWRDMVRKFCNNGITNVQCVRMFLNHRNFALIVANPLNWEAILEATLMYPNTYPVIILFFVGVFQYLFDKFTFKMIEDHEAQERVRMRMLETPEAQRARDFSNQTKQQIRRLLERLGRDLGPEPTDWTDSGDEDDVRRQLVFL